MGSAESSESRRVSFEMDEEERVRVLQGIRLSESVVNRMKDSGEPSEGQQPVAPPTAPPPTAPPPMAPPPAEPPATEPPPTELPPMAPPPMPPPPTRLPPAATSPPTPPLSTHPPATCLPATRGPSEGSFTIPQKEFKLPRSEPGGFRHPSEVTEEFKRFKEEQAAVQDELFQVVKREREAASKLLKAPLSPGASDTNRDKRHSVRLARELESREAELQRRDTFYKEQLGRIEKKAPPSRARVLRAPVPDPPLLSRPPARSAALLRPGQGIPALCQLCPQGVRSSCHSCPASELEP
ncbi:MICOS complex subunit Mic25-like isoform X3 [Dipodomys merriami]|uniref:MICOS complex subunit Mic25-like isoform X3 n=1 Tax=Dipodomys merriami TaxID=94247 RepID=UPI00384ABB4C